MKGSEADITCTYKDVSLFCLGFSFKAAVSTGRLDVLIGSGFKGVGNQVLVRGYIVYSFLEIGLREAIYGNGFSTADRVPRLDWRHADLCSSLCRSQMSARD